MRIKNGGVQHKELLDDIKVPTDFGQVLLVPSFVQTIYPTNRWWWFWIVRAVERGCFQDSGLCNPSNAYYLAFCSSLSFECASVLAHFALNLAGKARACDSCESLVVVSFMIEFKFFVAPFLKFIILCQIPFPVFNVC